MPGKGENDYETPIGLCKRKRIRGCGADPDVRRRNWCISRNNTLGKVTGVHANLAGCGIQGEAFAVLFRAGEQTGTPSQSK